MSNQYQSKVIHSNQEGIHPRLHKLVKKHLHSAFRKPYAEHNIQAFEQACQFIKDDTAIILDSGCGTAMSTQQIAARYPDHTVIGIDKSDARLSKPQNAKLAPNCYLIRADLEDFWRLAVAHQWRLQHHFILYPNPWPKAEHVQRRWHGSAVFKDILSLGGQLELRSNWSLYVEEFAYALSLAGQHSQTACFSPNSDTYISLFEKKYSLSGQALWRCKAQLDFN